MNNLIYQTFVTSAATLIVSCLTLYGEYSFAEEIKKDLTSSDQILNITKDKLIPMPIGNLESALSKVNSKRNPFKKPSKTELINTNDLYLTLQFKGLAKSGNKSLAIIQSEGIQKFYAVGDTLDNGFLIKSISFEDISVDISNGSKNYRLILNNFKKSL
tara:strand:- start:1695 stop:2171 length:477 start_codon:yes stop_codon:yes gene_type:complete